MREGDTADTLGGATQYRNTRNLMASSALCRNTRTCCSCSGSRRHRQHVGRSDALGEERRTGGGATHWRRSDALGEERRTGGGATHWGRSDALEEERGGATHWRRSEEERRTGGGATHWGRSDALEEERRTGGGATHWGRSQLHAFNAGARVGVQQLNTSSVMLGGRGEKPAAYIQRRCQGRRAREWGAHFGGKQDPTRVTLQLFNQNSDPCI